MQLWKGELMDEKIVLKNMMFYGYHGVYEYEQENGQRFYVDAELYLDFSEAAATDDWSKALDYVQVYNEIKGIFASRRFKLLEALAGCIAYSLLYDQVSKVTVRVRKPNVPLPGYLDYVEVETTAVKST